MKDSLFYTNHSDICFLDHLCQQLDRCLSFAFTVSFIKRAGLSLIQSHIEAALARGVHGRIITSTYQNFTDINSLTYFLHLQNTYPDQFACHLDKDCFHDGNGNITGFHSKGYLFTFEDDKELLVGSSNITVYALLKNVEWDLASFASVHPETWQQAASDFEALWDHTLPLTRTLISQYQTRLCYAVERWDMDYAVANAKIQPNAMQKKALKQLNRIRCMGEDKAMIIASPGSGKTYLSAFDAVNFNPKHLLYIVHEGSILRKSLDSFQKVIGSEKTFGIYDGSHKDLDCDFLFSTNVTMANHLDLFSPDYFDYIIIDEAHHAAASSYQKILHYFHPQFLLGMTATPERMDNKDVFSNFGDNVPYELRLRDAILQDLVVPFHYYGIRDELLSYSDAAVKARTFSQQCASDENCELIVKEIEKYRKPGEKLKALAFCRDVSHAIMMAQAMSDYYYTQYLTGRNSVGERIRAYHDLQSDDEKLEILFTVDILNEGVDIPGVNMVLFLRPTQSSTIFLQQLGRGLRKYTDKKYVTVLDFIGNDYQRSSQIAFALGSLSENFVLEKQLVGSLVKDDFKQLGMEKYGVEIHMDDLSKKEILDQLDHINFHNKRFVQQDYENFKKYLGESSYPCHMDYLNNECAPDLLRLMSMKGANGKAGSYYGFLKEIGEENLPSFSKEQETYIKTVSSFLPLVRPQEYLVLQKLLLTGREDIESIRRYVNDNAIAAATAIFKHVLWYLQDRKLINIHENQIVMPDGILNVEMKQYLDDLLQYGIARYETEFGDKDPNSTFCIWGKYRKDQIKLLLLKNPHDIMLGTDIYDGICYAYVTVHKAKDIKDDLRYADGFLDPQTFLWETRANLKQKELDALCAASRIELFVRKVEAEDGLALPFTYIGSGKMHLIPNSLRPNGSWQFRVEMKQKAPDDLYFDFQLPKA
ncbi:MAG: DUF3427 domain-containing protein [Lactimicrobium sp.]|jgi:superfamily II DNA or RNA helicase/HKD family nuclease|uniref:DUF3427 domain-containing protein n=1 Tax=Lactimicrobium sp. TaxID=2563780 RepID=UPI002F352233